jgi:hypothetical protein
MTDERLKRLVSASVVTAVFLLVILLTILVYQMVCLSQAKKELAELQEAKQHYQELKEKQEDEITLWLEDWKIEEAARKYGFRKNGN